MKLLVCCVFVVLACQSTLADWVRQPFWYDDARRDKVAKGTVWPQPKSIQTSTQSLSLNPDSFSSRTTANAATSDACKDVLDPALERYRALLFWIPADARVSVSGDSVVGSLRVSITGTCTKYPSLDSDESYSLEVPSSGEATLSAQTAWGALRGLETFSQLVYEVDGKHKLNVTTINDEPRFPHRGVMLDTARHFLPVPYIKQNLDAMSYNKINVFHWHIVDDQSFPFQSRTYPDLSGKVQNTPITLSTSNEILCLSFQELWHTYYHSILVNSDGATLLAQTAWGALRGLETFSQLIYGENGKHVINGTSISDSPRFPHRGIMIDTARHYLPLPFILRHLDAMAYNKMNVLHWHIVDDQAFPFQSTTFPDLSGKGAYTRKHVYTPDDVSQVLEFARLRGIRVIPEFDTPGHMMSWGQGHPEILTRCYPTSFQPDIYHLGPANPARETTYTFMRKLFEEIRQLFADEYFHVGGDEVRFQCWNSNEEVHQFMVQQGFPNSTQGFADLQGYYIRRILEILHQVPETTRGIVWQEIFDNFEITGDLTGLNLDTIIHVWEWNDTRYQGEPFREEMAKVTAAGYKAILSSCYYLNDISYGRDWPQYYECDPHDFQGTEAQKQLVMGGEACLWAEWVDSTNFIPRMWPRASAVAERLWSPQDVADSEAASPRMEEQRCRMVRRGIPAQPQGPSYCEYEWNILSQLPNYRPVITSSGLRVTEGLFHIMFLDVLVLAVVKCLA
ncbi:beta-hexosaminidase subunit beta-like [Branchiostoma floridae]|uniref:beta-N-acetylhexosaminidase n=1 Tax=Branchiostoma floridae TaxID=7739 RepID=A0A9J7KLL9_BRAFL|nr:beta-hexosaminidase subunit beta-like [Branchiostoma floridae]